MTENENKPLRSSPSLDQTSRQPLHFGIVNALPMVLFKAFVQLRMK